MGPRLTTYLRIAGALVAAGLVVWLVVTVMSWRADATMLPKVQAEFAQYRAEVERQAAEHKRRERISREVEKSYVAIIQQQDDDLRAAREQLRNVRLHVGACPDVSADAGASETAGSADAEGTDGQPGLVAEDVAERFAACDATGARLNALIDYIERLTQPLSRD